MPSDDLVENLHTCIYIWNATQKVYIGIVLSPRCFHAQSFFSHLSEQLVYFTYEYNAAYMGDYINFVKMKL